MIVNSGDQSGPQGEGWASLSIHQGRGTVCPVHRDRHTNFGLVVLVTSQDCRRMVQGRNVAYADPYGSEFAFSSVTVWKGLSCGCCSSFHLELRGR